MLHVKLIEPPYTDPTYGGVRGRENSFNFLLLDFIENYFMENDRTADLGKLRLNAGTNLDIVERI